MIKNLISIVGIALIVGLCVFLMGNAILHEPEPEPEVINNMNSLGNTYVKAYCDYDWEIGFFMSGVGLNTMTDEQYERVCLDE